MKRKLCLSDTVNETPNKKLKSEFSQTSEELWEQYEQAKEKGDHREAVKIFSELHQRAFPKANIDLQAEAHCSSPIKKLEHKMADPQEHYLTGLQYVLGLGYTVNYEEAIAHFLEAAEQGHPGAQFCLVQCYSKIKDIQNEEQASYWCKKSAEQGYIIAQFSLGTIFRDQDFKQACNWFKKAAEQGHVVAQYNLGILFKDGNGVTRNLKEAFDWFKKSAEQGFVAAQFELGLAFVKGSGVTQDFKEALDWLKKAAEQGDVLAQLALGLAFANGKVVLQNFKEAFDWFKKAAEQGNAEAQFNLGLAFGKGDGTTQNFIEACKWFKKAADQRHARAQYNLGLAFYDGRGVTQNFKEASDWYKKAAVNGLVDAQNRLGHAFANGHGVTLDFNEAVFWYRKAAKQGSNWSLTGLKEIDTLLALYTVAWIEKEHEKLFEILLSYEDVEQIFLEEDFFNVLSNNPSEILKCLQNQAQILDKDITSFLVNWLTKLDREVRSKGIILSDSLALWFKLLINEIECSEVKREHYESLMSFFCLHYLEEDVYMGEKSSLIEPMLKLWYKGQSFDSYPNERGTKNLFISVLIHHYFKGQYELPDLVEINPGLIGLLVCLCENKSSNLIKPQLLVLNMKLIEVQPSSALALIRLKTCLTSMTEAQENNKSFFSKINFALTIEGRTEDKFFCDFVFQYISSLACEVLEAKHSFFAVPLKPQERKLALLLSTKNIPHLFQWIKAMETAADNAITLNYKQP